MPIRVKDVGAATDKWARRVAVATPDYEKGVQGSGGAWETNAKASNDAWKQGVTQAAGRDAFSKGISAAGGGKYEQKTLAKGPARFGPGAAASTGDYSQRVGPYLQAIAGIQLPPRGPSGDPRNYARVNKIGETLSALKRR